MTRYNIIEAADRRDIRRFVRFPDDLYRNCGQYVPPLHKDQINSLTKVSTLSYCKRKMWLALDGKKIVGAFVLNADPQGNYQKGDWSLDLPDGDYMVLHALAIDPELQGRGLGAEVVHFCTEKAKAEGYKALRLDIVPGNIPAKKLYEKTGFRYVEDGDLDRNIAHIPMFSLYELNW